ncbi:MAG: DUF3492 domain-containing protein [Desulfobacteraceae bacterium]|nr:MAG: DUF3492 domain-containing protein [Desulfobacteraceae bacterium]
MEANSDICLVVEGCYPYVTGGVSSWLQWLIENLKGFSFSMVALITKEMKAKKKKYRFPSNVVSYQEYVIFDDNEIERSQKRKLSRKKWQAMSDSLFRLMKEWKQARLSDESLQFLREITMRQSPNIFRNFLEDERAFALMTRIYQDSRGDCGFVKYFYNFRSIHRILFRMVSIVGKLPVAPIYHTPGTGYAGLVACLRSHLYGGASVITEHGIYLQEREMELLKSGWLDTPYLRSMWIDMFTAICRWQYSICNRLITLTQINKGLQVDYGAAPERIRVIPNGIDIDRFKPARRLRCIGSPKTISFVGRIDSVKDVKTLIQAISIVKKAYPEMRCLVIGPYDEQPEYFKECSDLVSMLDLKGTVSFTGRSNVLDYYKETDLLLLTSIKEAMPLAVMEAMAAGIPVVATSVGACSELLLGNDDGIGQAGMVTRVMDAEGIAVASIRILKDPSLANKMARNGIARIERLYREELVIDQYEQIYREILDGRCDLSVGAAS